MLCLLQAQHTSMVQALCASPAALTMIEEPDAQGLTPLGQAVGWNYISIVQLMLDAVRCVT